MCAQVLYHSHVGFCVYWHVWNCNKTQFSQSLIKIVFGTPFHGYAVTVISYTHLRTHTQALSLHVFWLSSTTSSSSSSIQFSIVICGVNQINPRTHTNTHRHADIHIHHINKQSS